jgi:hypothetical protein
MRVLALDLSSNVGWVAGAPDSARTGGVRTLGPMIEPGRMFNAYGEWLCDALAGLEEQVGPSPSLVVMEAPMDLHAMARCNTPSWVCYQQMGLAAVTEYLCDRYEIPCRQVHVLEARRLVLNRSRGWDKKGGEIVRHLTAEGYTGLVDHNHADALVIWLYACAVLANREAAAA